MKINRHMRLHPFSRVLDSQFRRWVDYRLYDCVVPPDRLLFTHEFPPEINGEYHLVGSDWDDSETILDTLIYLWSMAVADGGRSRRLQYWRYRKPDIGSCTLDSPIEG